MALFRWMSRTLGLHAWLLAFVAAGSMAADVAAQSPQQVRAPRPSDGLLRWQFHKGQAFSIVMDQSVAMSMDIPGQPTHHTSQRAVTEMTQQILDVDAEGTASATSTIDRMSLVMDVGGQKMEFDTSSDEEPTGPMAEVVALLKPMIGKAISQDMAASGKVSNVSIPDGMLDAGSGNPIAAALMNKKSLEDMTTRSALEFPSENPEVGTTWQNVAELDMGGAMKVLNTTTYTYVGVKEGQDGPLHVIEATLNQTFPNGGAPGVDIKIVREDSKAIFYFDGVQGLMRGTELDQDMMMQITAPGQTLQQRIQQTMKTTFEVKSDATDGS